MRRAQGTGTITKTKRGLRKPYMVRVTERTYYDEVGKKHEKKKLIGYYETKKEAQDALDAYNRNKEHINLDFKNIKFCDLWEKWQKTKESDNLSKSTQKGYKYAYDKIPDNIRNKIFVNINFDDLQSMMNNLKGEGKKYDTLRKVRNSLSQLYDYAIKCEIVNKNYAKLLDIGHSKRKGETLIFTDEQIKKLWSLLSEQEDESTLLTIKIILMLIYNGCRISEFLDLQIRNMNMDKRYFFIADSKTEAGIRNVPINYKMVNFYNEIIGNRKDGYFLINPRTGKKFTYANFRDSFYDRLIDLLGWDKNLTPHNCRKTCISMLTKKDVRPTYIKLIVGHEGALDLTEKVYTYVDIEELIEAIDKI